MSDKHGESKVQKSSVATTSTVDAKVKLGFGETFLLSGIAAGISKTAAAPIERVKLLVQNQNEMLKQGVLDKPYNGVIDCASRVLKTEGVAPFWRGNVANVLRYFPTQALNFAFKDSIKAAIAVPKDSPMWKRLIANSTSGGIAGTLSLVVVYSLDYARTRMANDTKNKDGARKFNGLLDVYVKTFKAEGIQGLYRGFAISAVGIFVYRGLYFGLYDSLKPVVIGQDGGVVASFFLGWAVTITAGLASYPLDTVRRRMMMTSGSGAKYASSLDCIQQIVVKEGYSALMRGAGANILRAVAGAGVLTGTDKMQALYRSWRLK